MTGDLMKIGGLIFDFNGVVADDEPVHCYGFQQALKDENLKLSPEEYYDRYLPYDDFNFFRQFLNDRGRSTEPEKIRRLVRIKSQRYLEAIKANLPVIQPSVDFIHSVPRQIPLVIASGAAKEEIEFILEQLRLRERFTGIVAAEDVINGKPHPEAFLKALNVLQKTNPDLKAEDVVVIEDSYRGVTSARSAGMKCLALTTSYSAERLHEADLVIDSLEGWTVERLECAL